jgi:hypothetical protein
MVLEVRLVWLWAITISLMLVMVSYEVWYVNPLVMVMMFFLSIVTLT